ncbi:MAG: winged helix-turn-helix domain-containing protein [Thermofilum sp.]|jgi:ArsR family transcriptional regulator|nr:winged helix-turn-helix domain-containing protein [Thermofilum sp.]
MVHVEEVEKLSEVLQVLANPIRLKMLALIAVKPRYAYELSKYLKLSYPLTHLHLNILEKAGFISGSYVEGPRTKKVYRLNDFQLTISGEVLKRIGEKLENP